MVDHLLVDGQRLQIVLEGDVEVEREHVGQGHQGAAATSLAAGTTEAKFFFVKHKPGRDQIF